MRAIYASLIAFIICSFPVLHAQTTQPTSQPTTGSVPTQKSSADELKKWLAKKPAKTFYENALNNADAIKGWQLEGPAKIKFKDGWLHMWSPEEKGHHVHWCPKQMPASFIAQWEVQNMEDYGLCIIFFAAKGRNGEDVLDPKLPKRTGVFRQYIVGALDNYHISYFAHAKHLPKRPSANLRKNHGFKLVQAGPEGIAWDSTAIHKITLIKQANHILLFVDDRKIIDFVDKSDKVHGAGQMGFRQMQWTHCRYRNFKVWSLEAKGAQP